MPKAATRDEPMKTAEVTTHKGATSEDRMRMAASTIPSGVTKDGKTTKAVNTIPWDDIWGEKIRMAESMMLRADIRGA